EVLLMSQEWQAPRDRPDDGVEPLRPGRSEIDAWSPHAQTWPEGGRRLGTPGFDLPPGSPNPGVGCLRPPSRKPRGWGLCASASLQAGQRMGWDASNLPRGRRVWVSERW